MLPLTQLILGDVKPVLVALLGGVALLSAIGFVKVSSLLLLRAEAQRRETALRGALGATRGRLIRKLAVEGCLLALLGTGLGVGCGWGIFTLLSRLVPTTLRANMPFLEPAYLLSTRVIAAGLIFVCGLAFSAVPSMKLFISDMRQDLAEAGRGAAGRTWRKATSWLVMIELAVAMVLLVGASLQSKSLHRLIHVDLGMSSKNLALLHVADLGAKTDLQQIRLERTVLARISAIPGISAAGISRELAIGSGDGFLHVRVAGRSYPGEGDEANDRMASISYFETLRAHLLRGRYFPRRMRQRSLLSRS